MPSLVRAVVDYTTGWVSVRFGYDATLVATLKMIPGCKYDGAGGWSVSVSAWAVVRGLLGQVEETIQGGPPELLSYWKKDAGLRDYQVMGAGLMLTHAGFLLDFEQRVGKSAPTIAAATTMLAMGEAEVALILYPAQAAGVWKDQLSKWASVELRHLNTSIAAKRKTVPLEKQVERLRAVPHLFLGESYENLVKAYPWICKVLDGRRWIIILDEAQLAKEPGVKRTEFVRALANTWSGGPATVKYKPKGETEYQSEETSAGHCVRRWALTGTPLRNRPKDLWSVLDILNPGGAGFYGKFTERYCGKVLKDFGYHWEWDPTIGEKVQKPGHWEAEGIENPEELKARIDAISYRVTRAEVAPHLPKSDWRVIKVPMKGEAAKKYQQLEGHFAPRLLTALEGGNLTREDRQALNMLGQTAAELKAPIVVDRIRLHLDRGVKVVCFSHHHEVFGALIAACSRASFARYEAPGTKTVEARLRVIEEWKAHEGPAVLFLSTLATQVGIDLADAEVSIFAELEYVPSDLAQAADRIQDVHLGKRTSPPILEMVVAEGTIDADVVAVLLNKMAMIDQVVGATVDGKGMREQLKESGIAASSRLHLEDGTDETVLAAILSVRSRWTAVVEAPGVSETKESLAAGFAEYGLEDEAEVEVTE